MSRPLLHGHVFWLLLLLLPAALALHQQPYHLKLLAVEESDAGFSGSPADLYLEIREGSGRVFLDTQPLTKLDTQGSTRFAKEIACHHFKLNCQNYDFIYTIKADSPIIGGPSAGAAIAALTTVALLDLPLDNRTTITATVNSGGIIGPVGGIKEKLEAASRAGMGKVLLARGTVGLPERPEINQSEQQDLRRYALENLSLELVEVMNLDEVILQLTGKNLNSKPLVVLENQNYTIIMSSLANLLCARTEKIKQELNQREIILDEQSSEVLRQRQERAQNASQKGDYYSAASFCFGSNIQLKTYYYQQEEASPEALRLLLALLEKRVSSLEEKVKAKNIETISALQTLLIVKERLADVREQIIMAPTTPPEELPVLLAYAEERYFSAISWMQFFDFGGKKFTLGQEHLKQSCLQKISEAEERIQYVNLYGGPLGQEKKERAQEAFQNKEYELCLITAVQAKADANAVLSTLGVSPEMLAGLLESKGRAVERVITENNAEGIFPLLGFSYYQYAHSLQDSEPYTALVYYEYALEMSDLGIYFPEEPALADSVFNKGKRPATGIVLISGLAGGIVITLLAILTLKLFRHQRMRKRTRRKRRL